MDIDEVAAVAARLEGVRETVRDGRRGWYLGGRLVARHEEPGVLLVRCGFDHRERLLAAAPQVFSVTPRTEPHMKVLVDLRSVTPDQLDDLLEAAAELQRAAC